MTSPLMTLTPLPQQGQAPYLVQDNYNNPRLQNRLDGITTADFTSGDVTLTLDSGSTAGTASYGTVVCANAAAPHNLIYPAGYTGPRLIVNNSGQAITVKTSSAGTTVAVANGKTQDVLIDGSDVTAKSGVTGLSVTAPITDSGTGAAPIVGISAATDIAAGSMSAADKAKLDAATNTNTPSTLVLRDAAERAQFADPSDSQDAATKGYTDTADALRLKLDGTVAMTGILDMATHLISNLLDPVGAQDAATKASVAAAIAAAIVGSDTYKGTWNASTNSPALASGTGTQGWHYRVATAGTTALDGVSDWAVGDWAYFDGTVWEKVDNTDQVVSVQGRQGAVVVTPADLSLVIGTDVQAYDAKLAAIVALTWAADKLMYFTSAGAVLTTDLTAAARSFLASASDAAQRTYLGLVIGTNVQAWSSLLDAWAGKTAPSGTVVGTSDTQTLTNKRTTKRIGTATSSATPTINSDNVDAFLLTAQAADITNMSTNLSGTPTDAQPLMISITGTASRLITWGASFEASTVALPTTTSGTARLDCLFLWNAATNKFRIVAVA